MTAQSAIPLKWYVPFAQGDSSRVELPVTTSDPTRASQTLGFPPLTMQPPESGGVPPQGEDFNGGLNQVARIAWWVLNGGGWPYDSTFASNSNINGYPNGAKLQSADFRGDWINTADNNQNNPDTNGTNWVPGFQYGVTPLTGLTGGTVTLTPAQAAKGAITIAGTLTSALTLIVPNWQKNWTFTNNTTGAFVTIVKTAAGAGVTIPQNASPTRVSGDGTNIVQAPENIAAGSGSQAMQYQQATGRLIGTQVFLGSGTYTPTTGMTFVIFEVQGGGASGGGATVPSAGNVSIGSPGTSGAYARGKFTAAQVGASKAVTVGSGGAGQVGGGGLNGNTSSVGSLISASGGIGGTMLNNVTAPNVNGNGNFSNTVVGANISTTAGGSASVSLGLSGTTGTGAPGGASLFGIGGYGISVNATGITALNPGAGGSGVVATSTGSNIAGGGGAAGIVIAWEYA